MAPRAGQTLVERIAGYSGEVRARGTPIVMTHPRPPCPAPQIRNGRFSEDGDGTPGVWLPPDCPFGNLRLKLAKIELGVEEANRRIASAFGQWQRLDGAMSLKAHSRHSLDLESAVFLLQRAADELIAVLAVLSHLEAHGRYPHRIGIDSVGALLKHGGMLDAAPFRDHRETLRTLNDIDNAHKHTFIDANPALAGAGEPVIYALALRRTGLSFGPKFFHVPLRTLVEDFDRLYADCLAWLCHWSESHLHKAAA
jgi:hypothetical protein